MIRIYAELVLPFSYRRPQGSCYCAAWSFNATRSERVIRLQGERSIWQTSFLALHAPLVQDLILTLYMSVLVCIFASFCSSEVLENNNELLYNSAKIFMCTELVRVIIFTSNLCGGRRVHHYEIVASRLVLSGGIQATPIENEELLSVHVPVNITSVVEKVPVFAMPRPVI